eukprot:scaffold12229_cov32-Tisochrysis_lutea.AAC.3
MTKRGRTKGYGDCRWARFETNPTSQSGVALKVMGTVGGPDLRRIQPANRTNAVRANAENAVKCSNAKGIYAAMHERIDSGQRVTGRCLISRRKALTSTAYPGTTLQFVHSSG